MEGAAGLRPGDPLAGDFEIVRLLGEGGFGAVYEARQLSTNAPRALKVMRPELVKDEQMRARFDQEARVSAGIASDHVVGVIASGVDARGYPWLAMELLEGQPLDEAIPGEGFDAATALEILSQLCHGLAAAHEASVVHRDLKPQNVFLAKARRAGIPFTVKILDFGIAKVLAEAASTRTAALGTPLWAAPEQMEPGARVGPATDVWALGLIAFWLLTGRCFWAAGNAEEISVPAVLKEALMDPIPPPIARVRQLGLAVELPPRFGEWFLRCVDRDPAARYPDAQAAGAALTMAFAGGSSSLTALETRPIAAAMQPGSNHFIDRRAPPGQVPFARRPGEHPTGLSPGLHMAPARAPRQGGKPALWIGLLVLCVGGLAATLLAMIPWSSSSSSTRSEESGAEGDDEDRTSSDRSGKGKRATKKAGADDDDDPAKGAASLGEIEIACSPECFQVTVDGVDQGKSPLVVEVAAGAHSVEGQIIGGFFPPRRVEVIASKTTKVLMQSGGGSKITVPSSSPAASPPSASTSAPTVAPPPTSAPTSTSSPNAAPSPPPPKSSTNACGCPAGDLMCHMKCSAN